MYKIPKSLLILLCLFEGFFSLNITAQEKLIFIPRKGTSSLGISINGVAPLFISPLGSGGNFKSINEIGIYPGGIGSLIYQFFLFDNFSLGGELKYNFFFDKNYKMDLINPELNKGYILHMVPILVKGTYYIDISREFSLFFEGNAGISFLSYGEETPGVNKRNFDISPTLGVGLGAYWNINKKWSLGIFPRWLNYFEISNERSTPYVMSTFDLGLIFSLAIQPY